MLTEDQRFELLDMAKGWGQTAWRAIHAIEQELTAMLQRAQSGEEPQDWDADLRFLNAVKRRLFAQYVLATAVIAAEEARKLDAIERQQR